jgi:hypothetical protein
MDRIRHVRRTAALGSAALAIVLALAACGAAPTPTPILTPSPTPSPTPDPHLADPTTVDEVYRRLREAGIAVVGTNAQQGVEPVVRINATFDGWPLALAQYSSTTARAKLVPFRDGAAPSVEEAPYTFAGINIAVHYGPILHAAKPGAVPPDKFASATRLAAELDRLIGPLAERSAGRVSPVPRAATPPPSPAPSP